MKENLNDNLHKKKCKGCGTLLQNNDANKEGYIPDLKFDFCKVCFQKKNYGINKKEENDNFPLNFPEILRNVKTKKQNVIFVIDILNPFETLFPNINNFINQENVILIVNKRDIMPKSFNDYKIEKWIFKIAQKKNFHYDKIFIISSKKNKNIDAVYNYLDSYRNKNFAVLGYTNVGKTTFLKSLFASKKLKINNLISNSLNTTKQVIELNLKNINIFDYPGIYLQGSYQNIVDSNTLKIINPNSEIKVVNFQLKDRQIINISNFASFIVDINSSNGPKGFQFLFSNELIINRKNGAKAKQENDFKKVILSNLTQYDRYDLIISGLGIITFWGTFDNFILLIPNDIKYNLVESIYI